MLGRNFYDEEIPCHRSARHLCSSHIAGTRGSSSIRGSSRLEEQTQISATARPLAVDCKIGLRLLCPDYYAPTRAPGSLRNSTPKIRVGLRTSTKTRGGITFASVTAHGTLLHIECGRYQA